MNTRSADNKVPHAMLSLSPDVGSIDPVQRGESVGCGLASWLVYRQPSHFRIMQQDQ